MNECIFTSLWKQIFFNKLCFQHSVVWNILMFLKLFSDLGSRVMLFFRMCGKKFATEVSSRPVYLSNLLEKCTFRRSTFYFTRVTIWSITILIVSEYLLWVTYCNVIRKAPGRHLKLMLKWDLLFIYNLCCSNIFFLLNKLRHLEVKWIYGKHTKKFDLENSLFCWNLWLFCNFDNNCSNFLHFNL